MKNPNLFTPNFKPAPCWWDDLPVWLDSSSATLEKRLGGRRADVLIIGSGYTGLNAALQTSRAGLDTVVLDAGNPGYGCSTRNGGQISTSIKESHAALARKYGQQVALQLWDEGFASLNYIRELIHEEKIDCDFRQAGRFLGAHSPRAFQTLTASVNDAPELRRAEAFTVSREEIASELNTTAYHGGIVHPLHASLHPARYHRGLLQRCCDSGAELISNCAATALRQTADGFNVETSHGTLKAAKVIVATNGYTGKLTPWMRRRVIPIGSYIIATEEIPTATLDQIWPTDRHICDTRKVVYYYRKSPDGKRIIFGGRVHHAECDPTYSGPLLHAELIRLFPALSNVRISHSWMGTVAYTFDTLPHLGQRDGVYYAMGYCGSGVGMASYLGMKLGCKLLNDHSVPSALEQISFPTRPLYGGNPWFLSPMVRYYRWLDNRI